MANQDHAIVVGIQRYPGLPAGLQAPDRDAEKIHEWLVHPNKGGVPPGQARLIRSADFPAAANVLDQMPQRDAIVREFNRLDALAQASDAAGQGLRVGRRLYLYFSGHGFARRRKEGAIFTANATLVQAHHVFASQWTEWFYNAEYFQELVLWMDCCMVNDPGIILETVGFRIMQSATPTGRLFSAYAAKFPQQAVERLMPDGRVHGVFTSALLQGLQGAAADPMTGVVTSATLRDYLTNQMKSFLTADDLVDGSVAREPDFGADDAMVFCTVPPTVFSVTLTGFPASANGQPFSIVTGAPLRQVASGTVQNGAAQVQLVAGVYFLKMPVPGGSPIVKGFEVGGEASVAINVA